MSPTPFSAWAGPRSPKLVLVGEAFGAEENDLRPSPSPFVGAAGQELWLILGQAKPDLSPVEHARVREFFYSPREFAREREEWLHEAGVGLTNVFNLRPASNRIADLCGPRSESILGMPPLRPGLYVRREFEPELIRLRTELELAQPNLVVALGNTACWALLRMTNITQIRGTVSMSNMR